MKKININQIQKALNPQQSTESDSLTNNGRLSADRERVMDRLWHRLSEIYGHQLVSQYGMTIPESWERLLTGITSEQIRDGLNNLVDRDESWPPNAAEFRKLCLPKKIERIHTDFNDPDHPEYEFYGKPRRLEDKTTIERKQNIANEALKNLKDLL